MNAFSQYALSALSKILKPLRLLASLFPSSLPVGTTAFEAWASSIIELSGMPNNDSIRFTLATMIMHLKPTDAYKPKFYFVLTLRKAAANQIANAMMHDLKDRQLARAKAEQEAAASASTPSSAEVTAPSVTSNVSPIQR